MLHVHVLLTYFPKSFSDGLLKMQWLETFLVKQAEKNTVKVIFSQSKNKRDESLQFCTHLTDLVNICTV